MDIMNKIIKACGIAFILVWVLQATYLFQYFPFTKDAKENTQQVSKEALQLPESMHAGTAVENKTLATIQNDLDVALKLNWVKSLVLIVCGIILGCLLFMQKSTGYLLAFIFSFCLLLYKGIANFSSGELSLQSYVIFIQNFPLNTLREITMVLVLLITVIVLASVYVSKKLKRNEEI